MDTIYTIANIVVITWASCWILAWMLMMLLVNLNHSFREDNGYTSFVFLIPSLRVMVEAPKYLAHTLIITLSYL